MLKIEQIWRTEDHEATALKGKESLRPREGHGGEKEGRRMQQSSGPVQVSSRKPQRAAVLVALAPNVHMKLESLV